ncbi:hypothetical protein U27_01821 [Candidatus Vecturithrix granuli]|uniref:Uncharacterized protein n=1 Tax=Vecturithrix granuli TaxID=1499967 RepID=A0A0S6WBF0_VECG1|nr:hypothetical protein U27_01821 [Candidatus Vecturithrix granuli]
MYAGKLFICMRPSVLLFVRLYPCDLVFLRWKFLDTGSWLRKKNSLFPFLFPLSLDPKYYSPPSFCKGKKTKKYSSAHNLHDSGRECMSAHANKQDIPRHEEAGQMIARRLREARKTKGQVVCPTCHLTFDATYLLKCPRCRTLIGRSFCEVRLTKKLRKPRQRKKPERDSRKMELDFFA